mgnify:CR=1 FL=1
MIGKLCDVCGEHEAVQIACSAYGATSYAFCSECLSKGLEPYGAVVSCIACAGHFPEEINDTYRADVRRMLPLWGKTEAEFIRDVDAMIQRMEGLECP